MQKQMNYSKGLHNLMVQIKKAQTAKDKSPSLWNLLLKLIFFILSCQPLSLWHNCFCVCVCLRKALFRLFQELLWQSA